MLEESIRTPSAPAKTFIIDKTLQTPCLMADQTLLQNTLNSTDFSLQQTLTLSDLQLTPTTKQSNLENTPSVIDNTLLQVTPGSIDTTLQATPSLPAVESEYRTPPNPSSVLNAVRGEDIGPLTPVSELANNKYTSLSEAMKR